MIDSLNTSYAITHRGTVRQLNEDSHVEINSHNLWVVADGMGGHEAGDYASQLVVDVIKMSAQNNSINELTSAYIVSAIEEANRQLNEHSRTYLDDKTVGSTVVVLFIKEGVYNIIWVGDSRAYLYRNNTLTQISRDHSQVNELLSAGEITEAEVINHPLSNVITRAVGVTKDIEVDVIQEVINKDDLFLLCSDGLTGELSDEDISSVLDPKSIIDSGMALMHSSLVRGARDNVTCILVKNGINPLEDNEIETLRDDEKTIPLFTQQSKFSD